MNPVYDRDGVTLYQGDCLKALATMPDDSVDTIITDPPAGINFMGKEWDRDKGGAKQWIDWLTQVMEQCLRVAKPGAFALVWALPRTSHWTGTAIELAGWEIRDCIQHVFAQGFKKGLDIGKAIDGELGAEREKLPTGPDIEGSRFFGQVSKNKRCSQCGKLVMSGSPCLCPKGEPITPQSRQWDGWHSSLKPSAEFWWLAMKPLDGTFANNALEHGVSGLNIDACRISTDDNLCGGGYSGGSHKGNVLGMTGKDGRKHPSRRLNKEDYVQPKGRWPSHLFLSHHEECVRRGVKRVKTNWGQPVRGSTKGSVFFGASKEHGQDVGYADPDGYETIDDWECHPDCPVRILGEKSGERPNSARPNIVGSNYKPSDIRTHGNFGRQIHNSLHNDEGTASRFFRQLPFDRFYYYPKEHRTRRGPTNSHPTVKSLALMEEFCKLTSTPTGGIVLDPFAGSGTTLLAARNTGREAIGIEIDPAYCQIIIDRLAVTPEEQMQVKQKASKGYADLPLFGSNGA